MTKEEKIAHKHFYDALGNDLGDMAAPSVNGITLDGFFTPEEFRAVAAAYEKYLAALQKS